MSKYMGNINVNALSSFSWSESYLFVLYWRQFRNYPVHFMEFTCISFAVYGSIINNAHKQKSFLFYAHSRIYHCPLSVLHTARRNNESICCPFYSVASCFLDN